MHRDRVVQIARDVPLARYTTLRVGGPAWGFAEASSQRELLEVVDIARSADRPLLVLGGGSNVLISDDGYRGLVVRFADRRIEVDGARVVARAGADWDDVVRTSVDRGLGGIECLSGIPGWAGAAPIQNIGAYGQEIAGALVEVEALDPETGRIERIDRNACAFGYRTSRFKTSPGPIVTAIRLELRPGGAPEIRYDELAKSLPPDPSVADVRRAVLAIRRRKSMLLDPSDPNGRSAGSFFMNPIVQPSVADAIARGSSTPPPRYAAGHHVKLSAAWLIEQAGFPKGFGDGPAGLSTNHCLAIVNRGGATAKDIVALADRIRAGVRDRFGVDLVPEPAFVGFSN
jgi:UDP-N-acetylmuramate dehydrogenase